MDPKSIPHGGAAFPRPSFGPNEPADGMTLRDYFAAKAMQGCFSFWVQVYERATIGDPDPQAIAKLAYEYADEMLKAREA